MADVRALLRQQRQARRIDHPHAAYSDAGRLLCTLCREQIRAEGQWESHLRGAAHQRRAAAAAATVSEAPEMPPSEKVQEEAAAAGPDGPEGPAPEPEGDQDDEIAKPQPADQVSSRPPQTHKRKIDDDDAADAMDVDEAMRRKRSRADISIDVSAANDRRDSGTEKEKDTDSASNPVPPRRESNRTPPTLARRMSSTPRDGVEMQIPSRPATPAHRDSSSSSTPGGSTLAGLTAASAAMAAAAQASAAAPSTTNGGIATEKLPSGTADAAAVVDESEWAAFEADMAATDAPYADDAVISAPAMNAEESAAAAHGGEGTGGGGGGSRKSRADLDIEGEREDATRALEDEFDDMQELEARVRRLKEKREELRRRASSIGQDNGGGKPQPAAGLVGDAAAQNGVKEAAVEEEDEDEDDDDDNDDWDSFRFRK